MALSSCESSGTDEIDDFLSQWLTTVSYLRAVEQDLFFDANLFFIVIQ